MVFVKLIFFACIFSQAIIFLEASDHDQGIARENVKIDEIVKIDENVVAVDEVDETVKIDEKVEVDENVVVVDAVEENLEVVNEVENVDIVNEVEIQDEVDITEIEDPNAERDRSDGNLSGGLLDTRSDEERQKERVDNVGMVDGLEIKLHDNFEGEREMEN